jgi:hypothetical protein
LNLRPSGYEPDELPGCSTPRNGLGRRFRMGRGLVTGGRQSAVGSRQKGSRAVPCWPFAVRFVSVLGRPGSDRLSRVLRRSTIGAEGFDGRVRNGIGFSPPARATRPAKHRNRGNRGVGQQGNGVCRLPYCPIPLFPAVLVFPCLTMSAAFRGGNGLMRVIKPNERLVPVSFTRCRASTPGLSTWWSTTALQGELVLRWASRLDAFSGYPVRT